MRLRHHARVALPTLIINLIAIPFAGGALLGVPPTQAETGDETTYYLLTDHLGSVDVVLDDAGNVVERRDFLPYGSERLSDSAPDATKTDHKFTGKELDDETGLHYYGARYYDAEIGRFVSVDPWAGTASDPQTLNKYTYVLNNPVRFVDPNGAESTPAQQLGRSMLKFLTINSEVVKAVVQEFTEVVVTRDVNEGTTIEYRGTNEAYYKDNLSVKVGPFELNSVEVQSTVDYPKVSKDDYPDLKNGSSYDAKIGASGATKAFIEDTLQIVGAYFFHRAEPQEGKPFSLGCTITKNEEDKVEVMDILRKDLGFQNGETVKYSFEAAPQPTQPEENED